MQLWRVVHHLQRSIAVVSNLPGYPHFGVSFGYENARIAHLAHEFEAHDLSRSSAVDRSHRELQYILDILEFWWGHPARIAASTATLVSQEAQESDTVLTGTVVAGASVSVARAVRLPTAEALKTAPARLPVWLRLANDASQSSSSADAVRNYYMIWEDKNGRPTSGQREAQRLKFIRDFVSHGEPLSNPGLKAFLAKELGSPVVRYDPTDLNHRQLVADGCTRARVLIDGELRALLGSST